MKQVLEQLLEPGLTRPTCPRSRLPRRWRPAAQAETPRRPARSVFLGAGGVNVDMCSSVDVWCVRRLGSDVLRCGSTSARSPTDAMHAQPMGVSSHSAIGRFRGFARDVTQRRRPRSPRTRRVLNRTTWLGACRKLTTRLVRSALQRSILTVRSSALDTRRGAKSSADHVQRRASDSPN